MGAETKLFEKKSVHNKKMGAEIKLFEKVWYRAGQKQKRKYEILGAWELLDVDNFASTILKGLML